MSNWLANATGIHISPSRTYLDRGQFGGALKTLSPFAAFIPGVGPGLAAAIGAGGAALGAGIQPGSDFGDIVKSGAIGGAEGFAGGKLRQAIGAGSVPGASGDLTAGSAASTAAAPAASIGGISVPAPAIADVGAPAAPASPGFLSRAASTAGSVGDWLGNHDKTTSSLLGAASNELDPNMRRYNDARSQLADLQAQQGEYNFRRQQSQDLALEPLRKAIYGTLGTALAGNTGSAAPNPYTRTG